MDTDRFDALTRRFHSRRTALAALLGGVVAVLGLGTEEAGAHNPVPACKRIKDPKRRQACLRRARRHNRAKHTCKPLPAAEYCANRCGTARNNCNKPVSCTCPFGKICLANFGCNRTCTTFGQPFACPAGCTCGHYSMENPSVIQCYSGPVPGPPPDGCAQFPLICATASDCPRGSFCAFTTCGPNGDGQGRCAPTCPF